MAVFLISTSKNYEGSVDIQVDGDPEIVKGVDLLAVIKEVTRDHSREAEDAEKRMGDIEKRMGELDAKIDKMNSRLEDIIRRSENPVVGWDLNDSPDPGHKWMLTCPPGVQAVPVHNRFETPSYAPAAPDGSAGKGL